MRIGVTGVPGSGKTALAARLASLLDLPLIKSQAREVGRVLGVDPFANRTDTAGMIEFQKAVITSQIALEDDYGCFVTDSTTVDCLAHWEVCCAPALRGSQADRLYRKVCLENAKKYDALLYLVPPACGADLDLDRAIRKILSENCLPYRTLGRSDITGQVKALLSWLKKQGAGKQLPAAKGAAGSDGKA